MGRISLERDLLFVLELKPFAGYKRESILFGTDCLTEYAMRTVDFSVGIHSITCEEEMLEENGGQEV